MCAVIWWFSNLYSNVQTAYFTVCFPAQSNFDLTDLIFLVGTVGYGIVYFLLQFMALMLCIQAINWSGKNVVRNFQNSISTTVLSTTHHHWAGLRYYTKPPHELFEWLHKENMTWMTFCIICVNKRMIAWFRCNLFKILPINLKFNVEPIFLNITHVFLLNIMTNLF